MLSLPCLGQGQGLAGLFGQAQRTTASSPAPRDTSYPLRLQDQLPPQHYYTKLGNELGLLVIEDTSVPLATLSFACRGGRIARGYERSGVPQLLSRMLFGANEIYSDEASYRRRKRALALVTERYVGDEHTRFSVRLPSARWPAGARFLEAAIRHPRLTQPRLVRAKLSLEQAIQAAENKPITFLQRMMQQYLWRESGHLRQVWPTYGEARAVQLSAVRDYYQTYFQPHYGLVIVSGDVQHERVFPKLDSLFGDWQPPAFIRPKFVQFESLAQDPSFVNLNVYAQTTVVRLGWQLPDILSQPRDYYRAQLLEQMFNLPHGPLNRALGDTLAGQASARYRPSHYKSSLELTLLPYPGQLQPAIERCWQALFRLRDSSLLKPRDLQAARRQLRLARSKQRDGPAGAARLAAAAWAGPGLGSYRRQDSLLQSIRLDSLRAFAERVLLEQPVVQGAQLSGARYRSGSTAEYLASVHKPTPSTQQPNPLAAWVDTLAKYRARRQLAQAAEAPTLADSSFRRRLRDSLGQLTVYFRTNSNTLSDSAQRKLAKIARLLHHYPKLQLTVAGHSDTRGRRAYNLRLSEDRARRVIRHLAQAHAISTERLRVRAYGEQRPAYEETTQLGLLKNRRVTFKPKLPEQLQ
jgi:zinc protease